MTFELEFDPRAWKEWKKLGDTVRQQFKKKLSEVIERPRIEANGVWGAMEPKTNVSVYHRRSVPSSHALASTLQLHKSASRCISDSS